MDPFRFLFRRFLPWFESPGWAKWRAAILLAHVVAVVVVAFPAPLRKLDAATWQKPTMRVELKNWTARVNSLGVEASEAEVQAFASTWSERWLSARNTVVAPFKSYLGALGIPQNWYMFTGADRAPQRFALGFTKERGHLEEVFELGVHNRHPELVSDGFLAEHRVRRALLQAAWSRNAQTFDQLCRYFERQLRDERPDIDDVVCFLRAQAVEHPAQRDLERPESTARTLVLHRDGSAGETLLEKKRKKKGRK